MSQVRIPIVASGDDKVAAGALAMAGKPSRRLKITELMLRVAAAVCCIVTLVVLVTDKQTKVIQFPGFSGFSITRTAKFSSSKAMVYLVCAAGIGAGYALLVILSSFVSRVRPSGGTASAWIIFVFDQIVTYVLLAAAAASTEVAYLGTHPSADAPWLKICSIFGRFCNQLGAGLVTSFIATVIFAFSTAISAYYLFSKEAFEQTYSSFPHKG